MSRALGLAAATVVGTLVLTPLATSTAQAGSGPQAQASTGHGKPATLPGGYKHLVVIYEENHSFDNLYGGWGSVGGQSVDGLTPAVEANAVQRDQDGNDYSCLLQDDVNLTSPPLSTTCHDSHPVNEYKVNGGAFTVTSASDSFDSHFPNKPFQIDDYIAPSDQTCPKPGVSAPNGVSNDPANDAGGCTRDLVHRFYQEQYQLDGGRMDRYVSGSDAVGLTMGHYDTKQLPVYRYLHSPGAPRYVIADHFFQAAFGGSFLNHQWLIAAATPFDTGGATPTASNSVVDSKGMPIKYPLYTPTRDGAPYNGVKDNQLTQKCADIGIDKPYDNAHACGNYAVNTVQPSSPPSGGGAKIPLIDDNVEPNIGDRMTDAGISWAWYTGKWDAVNAGEPAPLFQYHHQPFNYFANYAAGQPGRAHLQDETKFIDAANNGTLPTVSFVKPYGAENEHPGYASEPNGSDHLVKLLEAVTEGPEAGNTLVVVTYDEFGGQWDHVPPPNLADGAPAGTADVWGPGTRIPAMVLARNLKHSGVDHTVYDTTSILATIERSFHLDPLTTRDAAVNDLRFAVAAGGR